MASFFSVGDSEHGAVGDEVVGPIGFEIKISMDALYYIKFEI